jgi:hypothetical protein
MSQFQAAGAPGSGLAPPVCPTCQGPLTTKLVCWACCERLCAACGQPTGSAFIELCWPCSYQVGGGELPATRGHEPAGLR